MLRFIARRNIIFGASSFLLASLVPDAILKIATDVKKIVIITHFRSNSPEEIKNYFSSFENSDLARYCYMSRDQGLFSEYDMKISQRLGRFRVRVFKTEAVLIQFREGLHKFIANENEIANKYNVYRKTFYINQPKYLEKFQEYFKV